MNKKNSSNKEAKFYSRDVIGYIKNEDNTISFGLLNEEKEQMKFLSKGSIYKFKRQGDTYILSSGYGHSEICKEMPLNELVSIVNNVNLNDDLKSRYSKLKELFSRQFYAVKEISTAEGDFNKFVHDVKHFEKRDEAEQQM